jgi:hypothetical protein
MISLLFIFNFLLFIELGFNGLGRNLISFIFNRLGPFYFIFTFTGGPTLNWAAI